MIREAKRKEVPSSTAYNSHIRMVYEKTCMMSSRLSSLNSGTKIGQVTFINCKQPSTAFSILANSSHCSASRCRALSITDAWNFFFKIPIVWSRLCFSLAASPPPSQKVKKCVVDSLDDCSHHSWQWWAWIYRLPLCSARTCRGD
jgi:hypothetical protein